MSLWPGLAYAKSATVVAAPTISSINYAQGDVAGGGQSIVLTGTNMSGVTTINVTMSAGTLSYTLSPSGTTATTVTFAITAHAAATGTFSVTNPGGTSGTIAFEFWSPASLSLSNWQKANYASAPWAGNASAGASTGRNLITAGSDPTTGATQGGFTPASFNGTANYLQSAVSGSSLWTVGAGSIFALYLPTSTVAAAAAGSPQLDPCIVSLSGAGQVCFALNSTGLRCAIYDGAFEERQHATGATNGTYFLGKMKWDSSVLRSGVNAAWGADVAAGAIVGGVAFTPFVGAENSATKFFAGRLLEFGTSTTAISDANYDKIRLYCNQRYGVSV
jgi:hypothetical protein